MDAVYMNGSESKLDDWELRYSLRSLEKNYKNLERVWIIGHLPKWAKAVTHIDQGDPYRKNKDANLIAKIVRLGYESSLSEKFIMMSDDHYFLQPSWDSDIKPYYNKDMAEMKMSVGIQRVIDKLIDMIDECSSNHIPISIAWSTITAFCHAALSSDICDGDRRVVKVS